MFSTCQIQFSVLEKNLVAERVALREHYHVGFVLAMIKILNASNSTVFVASMYMTTGRDESLLFQLH